ncbi:methylmalonyl-CoA:pyruvate transcarboxylase [Cutibacterium acnes JCM 18916]|nr:methylmalonyl-CoA:pyruvate transcarboxylase [Cutibacterium acnes JCM 18916]
MSPRKIGVTELVLRDAHQSLLATRMAMEDMVDACADIDAAGFWSVECWGGATFDSCIRFLNEDPWERLRTFRKLLPNSRLQMLLRGQNLLLPPLQRRGRRQVCREVGRERHGRVPGVRCSERSSQP